VPSRKCSDCEHPSRDGFVSTYSAWYPEPDKRVAYRTLHCPTCAPTFARMLQNQRGTLSDPESDSMDLCNRCHSNVDGVFCVTYLSVFVPKQDRLDIECWNCEKCAIDLRTYLQAVGSRLPDRSPESARAGAETSPWATLLGPI